MNQKEAMVKMMNGRKFTCSGDVVHYVEDSIIPFQLERNGEAITGYWELLPTWVEIKEWYEEIPDAGILCRVMDEPGESYIRLIKEYDNKELFDDSGESWDYAQPLDRKECDGMVHNGM